MSTNFKIYKTNIRTLRPNDPNFILDDGIILSPRAGFEITQQCPKEYKMILQECMRYGWITPVANVYDHELTWDSLRKNHE